MTNVSHNAYDFEGTKVTICDQQPTAQRVFIWKSFLRQQVADDDHFRALAYFHFGKVSTTKKRNTHGLKIVRINESEVSAKVLRFSWSTINKKRNVIWLTAEWELSNHSRAFDTGKSVDSSFQLLKEAARLLCA